METYIIKYNGKEVHRITAKSLRAAKIRTSKFCGNSVKLYSALNGVRLCDENGNDIASYSPFFFQWF